MDEFMERLHDQCAPLVESRLFGIFITVFVIVNPIALFAQVYSAYTAPSVEGIAVEMWYIFLGIQVAYVFVGIKARSASVFLTQVVCLLESIAVIAAVHIRR